MDTNYHTVNTGDELSEKCPVSGLPITSRPEWTDIQLTETYFVTFKFIGDRVLFVIPRGYPGDWGMKLLFEKRAAIIDQYIGPNGHYAEIRDLSGVTIVRGQSLKPPRVQMIDGLRKDQVRLLGFIFFNVPKTLQLTVQLGQKLYNPPFYLSTAISYETAINQALSLIKKNDVTVKKQISTTVTKQEWQLNFSNGATCNNEILNDNILYSQYIGTPTTDNIYDTAETIEKIGEYITLYKDRYYIISDIRYRASAPKESRKAYINSIKQLYVHYPFAGHIFCGAKRFSRKLFYLNKPFASFPAYSVQSLSDALALVRSLENKSHAISLKTTDDHSDWYSDKEIRQYAEELTNYLMRINWEVDGVEHTRQTPEEHPFGSFFDAIDLIKGDLDDVLRKRKLAQEELKHSEEKYRKIIEEIEDGYYEVNLNGDLTFINDPICRILGYPREELTDLNNREYMDKENATTVYKAFNEVYLSEKPVRNLVYEIIKKDGGKGVIDVSVSLRKNNDGKKIGFRGIMRDVTKQRQTDEALMAAKKAAEENSQAKSDLLANISHELRTPMNGILGMSAFLLGTDLDVEQREFADIVNERANHMTDIITDLLDFSNLDKNRLKLNEKILSLQTIIKEVADDAAKAACEKGLDFSWHCDPAISKKLLGDTRRIKQIINQLINNAIKFTPTGSVEMK